MLEEQLTYDQIVARTDARSLALGEDYFRSGAVHELSVCENSITAEVIGTELYKVTLTAEKDSLEYECECPYHDETGVFCKHCVAVALTYNRDFAGFRTVAVTEEKPVARRGTRRVGKTVTAEHLRDWLAKQSAEELTAIIWEHAKSDLDWRKRLFLRVAADTQKGVNVAALRKTIENATKTRPYPDAKQIRTFIKNVSEVLVTLKELLAIGEGGPVQELALFAADRVITVYADSNSSGDTLAEMIKQLIEIHRDAALLSPPDPLELAANLYEREVTDGYQLWRNTTETYARALGITGVREFRRLLFADWDKLPVITKETARYAGRFDSRRFRITQMMEAVARRENDPDLSLTILQRDLSDSNRYSLVVQALLAAGTNDDARVWAERALKEFGSDTNRYLCDFLVGEYKTRGEHGRSIRLLWTRFESSPSVESYQPLREYTEPLGEWAKWRGDALLLLRKRIAEKPAMPRYRLETPAANPLIDIYLWENNVEAAWETARSHGTDVEHWKRLALKREATHPQESLALYRKSFEKEIDSSSGFYGEALWFIEQIVRVYKTLDRKSDLDEFIADLRVRYGRKRKFITELNQRVK